MAAPEDADGAADTLVGHLARARRLTPESAAFTFVDFATDPQGRRTTVTWAELDLRVEAVAQCLMRAGGTGGRVAVVAPQELEYVVGFLGALRAGAIAVPLFPPHLPGHDERLAAALGDANPVCLITTPGARADVAEFCASRRLPGADRILSLGRAHIEECPPVRTDVPDPVRPRPEDCAYLQYTSGSTRKPAGVEITHANVVANVRQAVEVFDIHRDRNQVVSWLPLFHDMGLMLAVALPVVCAVPSVIMDPTAFVQQPLRWLRLLAHHRGAVTAAPNFAYDYCARRIHDPRQAGLALHDVSVMINGSEPIRPATISRFQRAFATAGLSPDTMRPSYGLAEATVLVSTSPTGRAPEVTAFNRELLGHGVLQPVTGVAAEETTELVACGVPVGQEVAIVDTRTRCSLPEDAVGEIWVRGPNVGRGYWRNPGRSADTFGATLATEGPSQADGAGPWLRTGDLGAFHGGCLYVTGRIKDLVVIDGVNHYPQDIEATVQDAHAVIRVDHVAAFSLTVGGQERLVVVAEHSRRVTEPGLELEAVVRTVRKAVVTGHGVALHDFVLVPPGTVPRTSSGKVARGACRDQYLTGGWTSRVERVERAEHGEPDLAGAGGEE
ncbi:fatty acyl-AMP ligase [Streptomyces sp.]|uniref:fatty acyl-AMP ligase n=1 Tax=Streptomyces sp. TaxID=1931 RepID=UPI002F3F8232